MAVSSGNSWGLTNDGSVYCWGSSFGGLFGSAMLAACPPDQQFTCTTRPRRIASPVPLTVLSMNTSFGFCWGENTLVQLGTGDQQDSNEPVQVVGPADD